MVFMAGIRARRTARSSARSVAIAVVTAFHLVHQRLTTNLAKLLPETLLPHLCIGMDSIENMTTKPTLATLSASGAGQPIFMHSNPNHLYQMLYGGISSGDIRLQHEARSNVMNQIEQAGRHKGSIASNGRRSSDSVNLFRGFEGCQRTARSTWTRLQTILRQLCPGRSTNDTRRPEFETDWHDVLLGSRYFRARDQVSPIH